MHLSFCEKINSAAFFLTVLFFTLFVNVFAFGKSFVLDSLNAPVLSEPQNNSDNQHATELTFYWLTSVGASNYELQISIDSNFTSANVIYDLSLTDTVGIVSGLSNNTIYFWRVRAQNGFVSGSWSAAWNFKTALLPAVPQLFFPADKVGNQNNDILFIWSGEKQNASYLIQLSTDSTFTNYFQSTQKTTSDTSINFYGLYNNSLYFWRVKSYNVDNVGSNWSAVRTFSTKLSTPQIMQPHGKDQDTALTFKWYSVAGADNYLFQVSLDKNFPDSLITVNKNLDTNEIELSPLKFNQIYYWRVLALNARGDSSNWSAVMDIQIKLANPNLLIPQNNSINLDTAFSFSWDSVSSAVSYRLLIAEDSLFTNIDVNSLYADRLVLISGLKHHQKYFWKVIPISSDGNSGYPSDVRVFKTNLAMPQLIQPHGGGLDSTLTFRWSSVEGSETYVFQVSRDKIFEDSSLISNKNLDTTEIKIYSLLCNHVYYWRVLALNAIGDSSNWSEVTDIHIKLAGPNLELPEDNRRNLDTAFNFTWSSVDSAVSYRLIVAEDSLFSTVEVDKPLSFISANISGLKYYQKYFWKVIPINVEGDTGYSSTVRNFKTKLAQTILNFPVNNSIGSFDSLRLSWNKIPGAEHYQAELAFDSLFTKSTESFLANENSYVLYSLLPDTTYYVHFLASNSQGDSSAWSNVFRFSTKPSIMITPNVFADTINLSDNFRINLPVLSITNSGFNQLVYDTIYTTPDSIFKSDKSSLVINTNSSSYINIKIDPVKTDTGLNKGTITLRRKFHGIDDSILVPISLNIKKAIAVYSPSSIVFDTIYSDSAGYEGLSMNNLRGNSTLVIKKVIITGQDSAGFNVFLYPKSIPPNKDGYFSMQFVPWELNLNKAKLTITTNSFPDSIISVDVYGYGTGGELSLSTRQQLESLPDTTFESLTNNDVTLLFKNSGNKPLIVSCDFKNHYFNLLTGSQPNNLFILPGDSITTHLRYMTYNFNESNIDTMVLYQNGVGKKLLTFILKGGFQKSKSINKIVNNIKINNNYFPNRQREFEADSNIYISLDQPTVFSVPYSDLRTTYYIGGDSIIHNSYHLPELLNNYIPGFMVTDSGLSITVYLLSKGSHDEVIDSLLLIQNFSPQVAVHNYKIPPIKIPLSAPAQTPDRADTKWVLFGFPFSPVYVDTIFKYFGGRINMKDGEWILYKYNPSAEGSFSIFNDEQFSPGSAYFFAQALVDTFKINKTFYGRTLTRSLSDTVVSLSGNGWKVVSDPYTFNVQVQPPNMLLKYDTDKKSYSMTNIMKPGEGYFVEPSVNALYLKTFGTYQPLAVPKIILDAGWYLNLKIGDKQEENDLLFSMLNETGMNKINGMQLQNDYSSAPRIQRGLYSFIEGNSNSEKYCASVKENTDGASWNIVVSNDLKDGVAKINSLVEGILPSDYQIVLFDKLAGKVIGNNSYSFDLKKDEKYFLKVIIGTKDFVNQTLKNLVDQTPIEFSLSQNYPNPFNPSTTIKFSIPSNGGNSVPVQLKVYDILGNEVAVLVNENKSPGYYEVIFNGNKFASGVYFYRLNVGSNVQIKKMILLK